MEVRAGPVPGKAEPVCSRAAGAAVRYKSGLTSGGVKRTYSESRCGSDVWSRVYLGGEIREQDLVKGYGRK